MTIKLIACLSTNLALGNKNKLLFHIPEDLKRFKELTTDKIVVMGRKTYESLPNGALPCRVNYVLSKSILKPKDFHLCYSVDHFLNEVSKHNSSKKDIYVIGGSSIYKEFLDFASELVLTVVDKEVQQADAFFPDIDLDDWYISEESESITRDELNWKYITLKRKGA